jgi:hypothetical protein
MSNLSSEIIANIMLIDNNDDLNAVIDAIKFKQKSLRKATASSVKASLSEGSKVKINLDNDVLNGVVVKVNRTKAVVTIPNYKGRPSANYTVPLSMLKVA